MTVFSQLSEFAARHAFGLRVVLGVAGWIAVAQAYPYDSSLPHYAQY